MRYLSKEPFSVGGSLPADSYYMAFPRAMVGRQFADKRNDAWVVVGVENLTVLAKKSGKNSRVRRFDLVKALHSWHEV